MYLDGDGYSQNNDASVNLCSVYPKDALSLSSPSRTLLHSSLERVALKGIRRYSRSSRESEYDKYKFRLNEMIVASCFDKYYIIAQLGRGIRHSSK